MSKYGVRNGRLSGQNAFTLIELMISILIGLIILGAVLTMFISMIRADAENLKSIRLNQELRATMSLIARDLRRSGFNASAVADILNPPAAKPFQLMASAADCILYSYDTDGDGALGANENYGFRLNGAAIETRENGELCDSGNDWQNLTDESLVSIDNFQVVDPDLDGNGNPGKTDGLITLHRITLTLTGSLVRDPAVSRTITETVEVRNVEF